MNGAVSIIVKIKLTQSKIIQAAHFSNGRRNSSIQEITIYEMTRENV